MVATLFYGNTWYFCEKAYLKVGVVGTADCNRCWTSKYVTVVNCMQLLRNSPPLLPGHSAGND